MTSLLNKLIDTYNYYIYDLADQRFKNYFLLSSPIPIVTLTGLYLYFCTSYGPRYMRHRPPYNLKNVVLLYNIFQVLLSIFLVTKGCEYIISDKFSFNCDTIDYSNNPRALTIGRIAWWYFIAKVTEYLDTIFFVLRKKNNQISFLHVYHHSIMVMGTWMGAKYFAGGQALVMGTLNSFVHVVMYLYYLIAGLGPQYQKYVWWKKHVTILQLVQFVIVLIHALNGIVNGCNYPILLSLALCANSILFLNLFGRFYFATYLKNKPDKNAITKNGTSTNGIHKNGLASNGTHKNKMATNGAHNNGTTTNTIHKNGTATNGMTTNVETEPYTHESTNVYTGNIKTIENPKKKIN